MRKETSGDKVGEKCEIMPAKNAECSRRQVGDKAGHSTQSIQGVPGDKWETSGDKPEIMRAKNPECSGRVVGDNWETSAKSCGPKHSKHPGCTGRQVGSSGRQVASGDKRDKNKPEIMRAKNPECSGGELGDKREIMQTKALRESKASFAWKQARRQMPNNAARACTPFKGVGTPHR